MIGYRDLVKKTMPESKKASASKDILGYYLLRPIENIISIPLIEIGVSANSVTIFSFYVAIFSILAFLIPGEIGFWLGWAMLMLWNLCDGIDGNIARYTDTCSTSGELLDAAAGWVAIVSFYFGMGMCAYFRPGIVAPSIDSSYYIIMGCMSGMFWIFPRTVMHKKAGINGNESVVSVKSRSNYGIIKTAFHNITSINGFGFLIFTLMYLIELNAVCIIIFFLLSTAVCTGSLFTLLGREKFETKK